MRGLLVPHYFFVYLWRMVIEDIEDYVSFETAKLLKEKGFDKPCNNRYYETHSGFDLGLDPGYTNSHWEDWYKDMGVRNYSAPTLQMAMKWLLEMHHLLITTFSSSQESWMYRITKPHQKLEDGVYGEDYETREMAREAAIKYCLENLI